MDTYFIKDGYRLNLTPISYLPTEENAEIYQYDVYLSAKQIIERFHLSSVLDIGCGYGTKLVTVIHPICGDITGIDVEVAIKVCTNKYGFGNWYVDNIENPKLGLNKKFDLIIAADVIEHLVNPDALIEYIKRFLHDETFIIISTPERDLVRGKGDLGAPQNPAHVREWNRYEFRKYLEFRGFSVISHFLVAQYKRRFDEKVKDFLMKRNKWVYSCQVVLCEFKENIVRKQLSDIHEEK